MKRFRTHRSSLILATACIASAAFAQAQEPLNQDDFFPIVLYGHWSGPPVERMLEVVDDAQAHGFNTVNALGETSAIKAIQAHAMQKGMVISGFMDSLAKIRPNGKPSKKLTEPVLCVNAPEYEADLHKFLAPKRARVESLPRFWANAILDEPSVRADVVCHCDDCKQAFQEKYGVAMPDNVPPVTDPALRRKYAEFNDDYWMKVWNLTRKFMKANNPHLLLGCTYTENLCFGRHVERDFGNLLTWAKPLDWLAGDIYPYYGGRHESDVEAIESDLRKSRLLLAFLRCAGREHGIPFAWWVGCTSSPEGSPRAIRHMSYTAIGQGAQGLIGWGAYFPEKNPLPECNPALWEDAGQTFRDIGKVGRQLRQLKKTSHIALLVSESDALLVPPSQYVGIFDFDLTPAYDALLKSFGNADLIYERQVAAGKLKDYQALVMANVRHVSDSAAKRIEEFVRGGGVLLSDTVPELNENAQPSEVLAKVFGRRENTRIWNDARTHVESRLHVGSPDRFPKVLSSAYEQGTTHLLGFRIGSFYNVPALWDLLRSRLQVSGVDPLAVSSNPQIEANYLAGKDCFVIVAVNRDRQDGQSEMTCLRPALAPKEVRDMISGQKLPFRMTKTNGRDALSFAVEVEGLSGRMIGVYP